MLWCLGLSGMPKNQSVHVRHKFLPGCVNLSSVGCRKSEAAVHQIGFGAEGSGESGQTGCFQARASVPWTAGWGEQAARCSRSWTPDKQELTRGNLSWGTLETSYIQQKAGITGIALHAKAADVPAVNLDNLRTELNENSFSEIRQHIYEHLDVQGRFILCLI